MFVNTFRGQGDTIITVKTPQYIIYFYYPHSKIPSPKGQQNDGCSFLSQNSVYFGKQADIMLLK